MSVSTILVAILEVFSLVLLARSLLSWIQPDPRKPVGQIYGVLVQITEPVVGPVRRMLPAMGPFDFSSLIVLVVINVILVPLAASLS